MILHHMTVCWKDGDNSQYIGSFGACAKELDDIAMTCVIEGDAVTGVFIRPFVPDVKTGNEDVVRIPRKEENYEPKMPHKVEGEEGCKHLSRRSLDCEDCRKHDMKCPVMVCCDCGEEMFQ